MSAASSGLPPAELTVRAVLIGLILAVVMGAANVYLGLKAGLTVSASIPAAVLASLILRSLGGASTRLEANQVQTAASAGESLAAGIIFTMPALLLIGYWARFEMWSTTLIALTGGLLGVLFMIPMRRVFVVDSPELPYPEGVACAAVLEASDSAGGETAATGAGSILAGGFLGAVFKIATSGVGIVAGALEGALATPAGRVFFLGGELSPALVAVGFIVRLEVALLVALGGAFGWILCIPLLPEIREVLGSIAGWIATLPLPTDLQNALALRARALASVPVLPTEASAVERAYALWSTQIRYTGVGAMAVGGVAALWRVHTGLTRAIGELARAVGSGSAARGKPESDGSEERPSDPPERDLAPPFILGLGLLAVLGIGVVYLHFTGQIAITLVTGVAMLALSFFFVAVASYIVGLVGNSNSPVSGMTITAVLVTALLLYLFGYTGMQGMVATLGVAAVVCCAACTAGDVCNDLKTGRLVGASPRRQQIMQVLGVTVASLVMAPVLQLLQDAYGIGSRELSAPQAGLFANLVRGFFGDGALPWEMIALGAAVGLGVLAIDRRLARRGSTFRAHLMPVAVGIYLPFGLALPIALGGLLAWWHTRSTASDRFGAGLRRGVLFSSGIIAGEALLGVGIALVISSGVELPGGTFAGKSALSAVAAVAALVAFYVLTRPNARER